MNTADDLRALEAQVRCLENQCSALRATHRDAYAQAALSGLIAYGYSPREAVVDEAFRIADLALKARGA